MIINQLINGYLIIGVEGQGFSTKGGGLSKWTFAQKDGCIYFMKEFLSPIYPIDGCPGDEELKARKRTDCEEFVKQHQIIKDKVDKVTNTSYNLINTLDFFLSGTKYYKITRKISAIDIDSKQIASINIDKKISFLKILCKSISILHNVDIVHGDLKPENILIEKTVDGSYIPNLIDYDNCYLTSNPPPIDKLVGDLPYYSPELENYALGAANSKQLTQKSDIFALGLLFCQYLTGQFPNMIPHGRYASSIVNNGSLIQIDTKNALPSELVELTNLMLLKNPTQRPNINEVLSTLNDKISKKNNIIQIGRIIINKGQHK